MLANECFCMRHIYGKHILMPVRRCEGLCDPVALSDTAAEIWTLAAEGKSRIEVMDFFAREYGLEDGSVQLMAVDAFVDQLISSGLIYEIKGDDCND